MPRQHQRTPTGAVTFSAAQLADTDALVTSIATSAAGVTYTGAGLTGVLANPGPATMRLSQLVTVTTNANPGTYTLTPIVFTGTRDGAAVTATLTLTLVGGGETLLSTQAFDTVTSIARQAMNDAGGLFEFGVRDALLTVARPAQGIRYSSAGNALLGFDAGVTDTVPGLAGEKFELRFLRVFGSPAPTGAALTIFV